LCDDCTISASGDFRLLYFCIKLRFDTFIFMGFRTNPDLSFTFPNQDHENRRIIWMRWSHQWNCGMTLYHFSSRNQQNDPPWIREGTDSWTRFGESQATDSMSISTVNSQWISKMVNTLSGKEGWSGFEWFAIGRWFVIQSYVLDLDETLAGKEDHRQHTLSTQSIENKDRSG
jgi:hypothetical protein